MYGDVAFFLLFSFFNPSTDRLHCSTDAISLQILLLIGPFTIIATGLQCGVHISSNLVLELSAPCDQVHPI